MNHTDCTKCAIHGGMINVGMGGNGSDSPDILVVLDYVSKNDDKHGSVGHPSGSAINTLREVCAEIEAQTGLTFRFTTSVRCTPTEVGEDGSVKTRTPTPKEVDSCNEWLREEILGVKPKVIVSAGATSLKALLGKQCRLGDMRGTPVWHTDGIVYVPTFSPINMLPSKRASLTTPEQYTEMIMSDLATAARVAMGEQTKPEEIQWKVIKTKQEALQVLTELSAVQHDISMVAVDIETNSYENTEVDNIFKPGLKILCVGLSWEEGVSHVVPLAQDECAYKDDVDFQREWVHALWSMKCKFVLQNGIYDFVALHLAYGVEPWHDYHDTLLMHHLLWSHRRHSLREMAKSYTPFGGYDDEVKSLVSDLRSADRGYHKIPFSAVARKNAYDAALTRSLGEKFLETLSKDEQLLWVYNNVTIPVTEPLMRMSLRGISISEEDARQASVENKVRMHKLVSILEETDEWQKAEEILESKIDVSKPMHRAVVLFHPECVGLTPIKVSAKTGMPSTDKTVLEELAGKSDVAYAIKIMREMSSFQDKVLKPVPRWIGFDGRVHTTYKVHGTRTGRLSSADPNLQNLPRSSMGMIKAAPGYTLIVCDISQAEIRVNAVVCGEPMLLDAYASGVGPDGKPVDIHATVAQDMFGIPYDQAKTDESVRRTVKGLNFGMCIAEGQRVLTHNRGLVPIEHVELTDLVWDGVNFVNHEGVVCVGYKEVITYSGLTATPDHKVWTADGEKVCLACAEKSGVPLAVTALGGRTIKDTRVEYSSSVSCNCHSHSQHGGRKSKVYDIMNAGPLHRFTVEGRLVSNCYGMTSAGLSVSIKKSVKEAQELIDLYFAKMPRIKKVLFEGTKERLLEDGYVRTLFGRYWHLSDDQKAAFHEIRQKNPRGFWDHPVASRALRQAANCLVQSSSSDITNRGLIKFYKEAREAYDIGDMSVPHDKRNADMYMSNQIHDSVIVEAKEDIAMEVASLLKNCMQTPDIPFEFPIPWVAEIKMGYSLGTLSKAEP